ncbi:hypothetical protein Tco_1136434 [Tanacetum coccineum]
MDYNYPTSDVKEAILMFGNYNKDHHEVSTNGSSSEGGNTNCSTNSSYLLNGDASTTSRDWPSFAETTPPPVSPSVVVEPNTNPPPTNNPPVLPTAIRARVVQELNELQAISTYIDSRLENIDQFLNGFTQPSNEIDMDDLELDDESVDTPLVSPFLDSDDDSDDGEVLNELDEYGNTGHLCRQRAIISFDGDDLAF